MAPASLSARPLVVHVLHRFDVGGLENGVVNLINHMPTERFRHAVVALTEIGPIRARVQRDDVQYFALNKPPGHGVRVLPRFVEILRNLAPAVVHTRNIGTLEMQIGAAWAGVPARVHGEHGWDVSDPQGTNSRYRLVRRLHRPFVHRWVGLSHEICSYLSGKVGVPQHRVQRICNGVDMRRFHPAEDGRVDLSGAPWSGSDAFVVGTVGRLQPIKDQVTLALAFARAVALSPLARQRLRLAIIGDGPLRANVSAALQDAGVHSLAWLAGERSDVPQVMHSLDLFVLPSLAEGISNTILEAMASGLPIVATRVGGNPELVADMECGRLVEAGDVVALAQALLDALHEPKRTRTWGASALERCRRYFSLDAMVAAYTSLYERVMTRDDARRRMQPT